MSQSPMPSIFLAHGAPPLLDDPVWVAELRQWAERLPRPRAVLMVSAHWEARPTSLAATTTVPLVYDFYGFPERFYQLKYPAPGAPELAGRVEALLGAVGERVTRDATRGLDHGAWVPLLCMYPGADIPVLQLSMPTLDPGTLFRLGRALAPLRDEGVLVVGSGFLTHNMRSFRTPGVQPWAREFDEWVADAIARRDVDALIDFEAKAPAARVAHPRTEHYVPLLVAMGAAADSSARPTFPITGFWQDLSFTRRSVELT